MKNYLKTLGGVFQYTEQIMNCWDKSSLKSKNIKYGHSL